MRACWLGRRLVGLPLFLAVVLAVVLVTTPALAALTSRAAPPSAQTVTSGEWRLRFSESATPGAGTTYTASQSTGTLLYLVNTGATAIPGSYSVTVTATSSNGNANVAFSACVGGTWASNTCSGSTPPYPIGGTDAPKTFTVGNVRPGSAPALPAGGSVHVRVQNNSLLGLGGGTATLSVTVAPR